MYTLYIVTDRGESMFNFVADDREHAAKIVRQLFDIMPFAKGEGIKAKIIPFNRHLNGDLFEVSFHTL